MYHPKQMIMWIRHRYSVCQGKYNKHPNRIAPTVAYPMPIVPKKDEPGFA